MSVAQHLDRIALSALIPTRAVRTNEDGYDAGIEGLANSNPHREGSPMSKAWAAGYEQGCKALDEMRAAGLAPCNGARRDAHIV